MPVHRRLRLLTFTARISSFFPAGRTRDLSVPAHGASLHARFSDHAKLARHSRSRFSSCCLPPSQRRRRPASILTRLIGWPVNSPTEASPSSSRMTTHGTKPMWFATLHRVGLSLTALCRSPGALQKMSYVVIPQLESMEQ